MQLRLTLTVLEQLGLFTNVFLLFNDIFHKQSFIYTMAVVGKVSIQSKPQGFGYLLMNLLTCDMLFTTLTDDT